MERSKLVAVKQRNFGIDLLRIVSMLMVVILHVLGQGGVLKSTSPLSLQYETVWLIEIACYCAVNCYGLISGYVGIDSGFKYCNVVYIWIQGVFYFVSIAAAASILSPHIYLDSVLEGFTPVSKNLYWYLTAYFCMYFFIPLFNKGITAMNYKQLKASGIAIFMLFCVLQILAKREVFYTNKGYSALWLALLYILGAIIKKTGFLQKTKGIVLIALYFGAVILTWLEKFVVEYLNMNNPADEIRKNYLVNYISPTILISAVALLVFFSKLKIHSIGTKIITFFAPLSFGVYLIHVQKHVWDYILKDRFTYFGEMNTAVLVLSVLGNAVAIFVFCALIDFVRDRIFKFIGVKKLLAKAESKFLGNIWS